MNRKKIHGDWGSPEYTIWNACEQRCNNPKAISYKNYGGRGIKFLFKDYQEFLLCIGRRPSSKHSIDRIKNDGNYEPGNVRWATKKEQCLNKRTKINKKDGLPRGVRKVSNRYQAYFSAEGKQNHLGSFKTIIEAEKAFLFAYFRYHKDLPVEYQN